jgi:hypothetical protein
VPVAEANFPVYFGRAERLLAAALIVLSFAPYTVGASTIETPGRLGR